MEEKTAYKLVKSEINREKMNLTVAHRRPQYPKKSQEEVKHEIEAQLYLIFKKYV